MDYVNRYMQKLMDTILDVRYSDLELALDCCQKLLKEAECHSSAFGIAFAYVYLGDYYLAQNDTVNCGPCLIKAKELCLLNSFQELYMQVCHFTGIYYSLLYDEQSSLQYYLDALELARLLGEVRLECLILNNIADIFQCRDDFNEAKRYFLQALNRLVDSNYPQNERHKTLILSGLSELFIFSGDLPMAELYLHQCEAVQTELESDKSYQRLVICKNRCCYAGLNKDSENARWYAEQLLKECQSFKDKYVVIGAMFPVCGVMIDLEEKAISHRLISELSNYCTTHELYNIQRLMALKIRYHKAFSGEDERNQSYQEFYHMLQEATAIENQVRTNGMKAKIHLRELIKHQEIMLAANKQLESEAHLDELTGIYNRRYMNKQLSKLGCSLDTKRVGIVMLDVDYFKEYNDNYGHAQGDQVLVSVAATLKKFSSESIYPGRYGGDEFICFCTDCQDGKIEDYIKNIRGEICALAILHEKSRYKKIITLSIGYSNCVIDNSINMATLVEQADQALYESKSRGRDRWSRYRAYTGATVT